MSWDFRSRIEGQVITSGEVSKHTASRRSMAPRCGSWPRVMAPAGGPRPTSSSRSSRRSHSSPSPSGPSPPMRSDMRCGPRSGAWSSDSSTGRWPTTTRRSASTRQILLYTSAAASSGARRRRTPGRSPTFRGDPPRPEYCGCLLQPWPLRGVTTGTSTARSPTMTRPSDSNPRTSTPTTTAASPGLRRRPMTGRSPTTTGPSDSTRISRPPTTTVAPHGMTGGVRPGDRRLRPGHPPRPERCPRL